MATESTALAAIRERKARKRSASAPSTPATPPATDRADVADIIAGLYRLKTDKNNYVEAVHIQQIGFLRLLRGLGFRRYDTGETFIIVRIQNNVIEQTPIHRLREVVIRWTTALHDDDLQGRDGNEDCLKEMLLEKMHRSLGTLTTDEKIGLLFDIDRDDTEITIVQDTIREAFYFFRNGFVTVSREGIQLRPYDRLPGYVWKDQILPRDFEQLPAAEVEAGYFARFARNVSEINNDANAVGNPERYEAFRTITGYNLHRFFETKLRATIFLDARTSEDPDGRSGKSLFCKAMRAIFNAVPDKGNQCIILDGKKYDENNRFNLDQLHISTKLTVFDDIRRGLKMEEFFNAILDGLIVERKGGGKDRIMSKLIFTLNYTLAIRGGSAKDRVVEFEFADYYSSDHSPEDEFGHWFFRDWDAAEWARFDNWMMQCVVLYFQKGLIIPETINLKARKLRDETCQEFIDFMEGLDIQHEQQFDRKELYTKFVDANEDGKPRRKELHWVSQRTMTSMLRLWAEYRPEIAGLKEWQSSGKYLTRFFHNSPISFPEHLEGAKLYPGKSDRCKLVEGEPARDGEKLPF